MADRRDTHIMGTNRPRGRGSLPPTDTDPMLRPSVLLVGQRSLGAQRRGRFVAGSGAHPARMAPDLAATLIVEYTQPGDWVFDPLAGIGTTLVEAIHAGRNGFGIEIEPRWVALARANIVLARCQGGTGSALIVKGDATQLPHGVPAALHGRFALVLTSPPYGKTMHGRIEHRRGPLTRFHNRYSSTPYPTNLAHRGRAGLIDGITAVLAGCVPLLRPGGVVAVVSRPWRRDGLLVDLPSQIIDSGIGAGLQFAQDRRACHAAARDGRLIARHSFYQLHVTRRTRAKGRAVSLPQHDLLAIFQKPTAHRGPHEPADRESQRAEATPAHGPNAPVDPGLPTAGGPA
jgi:hypothetical protein